MMTTFAIHYWSTVPVLELLALVGAVAGPHPGKQETSPPAAYSVGASYDLTRNRLIVFGGYLNGQYVGSTWEWDGATWREAPASGPSARNSPAMVYDAARKQTVMFGGDTRSNGAFGDTWTYDGATWRKSTADGPPARTLHTMVYDSRRERVVLFGGGNGPNTMNDTWEWDGQRWTQMATTGPAPRALHVMSFDAKRGRTVLYGGMAAIAPNAAIHGDTWEWDGTRWTQTSSTGPAPRHHAAMTFDPSTGRTIMHGGSGASDVSSETWTYDGITWTRVGSSGPRRQNARLVFDAHTRSTLLYGGFDQAPSAQLWRLTDATWSAVTR